MQHITLPIAELKPALVGLGKVIQKRPTLPVLGMIKVERTADGWIALTSTDLDSFATVRLEQPSEGNPLTVLVPFDDLQTSIKSCGKTESIQLHKLTDELVAIKTPVGAQWAETRCTLPALSEFPTTPKLDGDLVAVPDAVRTSIHEAMQCASEDGSRLILNAAYIDVSKKDCHCVVGTDGRHLYSSNSFTLPLKQSVIIPTHRFIGWKEFNADGEWRLKAGASAENKEVSLIQLSTRRWRFITRQHDGNYPNWRQVVPSTKDTKTVLEIGNSETVIQAIQRMPDHDARDHSIGLVVEGETLLLLGKTDANDSTGFSVPIPNVTATGKDMRVSLNRLLLTKALDLGLTRIELIDEMSPLLFISGGRQMVVMPVRSEGPVQTSATKPVPAAEPSSVPSPTTVAGAPNEPAADTGNTGVNTSTPSAEVLIEDLIAGVEALKAQLEQGVQSAVSLRAKLKVLQREHRNDNKELLTARKTLTRLQSVKL